MVAVRFRVGAWTGGSWSVCLLSGGEVVQHIRLQNGHAPVRIRSGHWGTPSHRDGLLAHSSCGRAPDSGSGGGRFKSFWAYA